MEFPQHFDPISFTGGGSYKKRVLDAQRRTGLSEAVVTGVCQIEGTLPVIVVLDFGFLMATAITTLMALAGLYIPVFGVLVTMFIPLPILFYRLRLGRHQGAMVLVVVTIIVASVMKGRSITSETAGKMEQDLWLCPFADLSEQTGEEVSGRRGIGSVPGQRTGNG